MRPLLFCLALAGLVQAFNVDLASKLVHLGPAGSWFGYDVDIYKHDRLSWMMVGAPKAQTGQIGVQKGGAVYKCSTEDLKCAQVEFDREGNQRGLNGTARGSPNEIQVDSKSFQWFGSTVVARGDAVLACAPHYVYHYSSFINREPAPGVEPVGRCILATDQLRTMRSYSPCLDRSQWGYHRLGFCMAGFSAAISSDHDKLFIGAPGAYYWHGAVIVQNTENERDIERTSEGPQYMDDTYTGYSTMAGDFNGDGIEDSGVGIPKGNNLTGLVALYDYNLRHIRNITGEQVGSYFGAAIAASDIDGDGLDDVIVGAPLFSDKVESEGKVTQRKYEVGKVHVFFQGREHRYVKSVELIGVKEYSRFGYDVAAVGDLDGDGYNDIVVGAPYDGPNKRGIIYVYHGKEGGINDKPAQVIKAEEIDNSLTTFGFSVAGGKDVDDNEYPDLVIGAYASNKAIILRTKPVVKVAGNIDVTPKIVDLEEKQCSHQGQAVACGKFQLCLKYDGKGVPRSLTLNLLVTIDAEKEGARKRSFFLNEATVRFDPSTISKPIYLRKKDEHCEWLNFYVANDIRDKLNKVVITANYSIPANYEAPRGELVPALNSKAIVGGFELQKECGPDNVCIPDLQLTTLVDKTTLVIGADDKILIEVSIENAKEDAYEAQFFLTVPAGLEYILYNRPEKGTSVSCSPPADLASKEKTENVVFTCDLGNPLLSRSKVAFSFEFATKFLDRGMGKLELGMKVNSTNNETEDTLADNEKTIVIPMEVEANLDIVGNSIPESFVFDNSMKKSNMLLDEDIGPLVTHQYEIINRGPSEIKSAVVDIFWPSFTQTGHKNLLYLFDDPEVDGNSDVVCRIFQQLNVNPNSLTVLTGVFPEPEAPLSDPVPKLRAFVSRSKRENRDKVESASIAQTFRNLVNKIKEYGRDISNSGKLRSLKVDCSEMACTQIHCEIPAMQEQGRILIKVNSRLWVNTLIEEAFFDATISSVAIAKVTELPFDHPPTDLPVVSEIVSTVVTPKDQGIVERTVPIWLILIAVLAGITFLILLILLLWKLGFFKRTRPPRAQATVAGPPESEYYGYTDYNSGYAPGSLYSEKTHGQRL